MAWPTCSPAYGQPQPACRVRPAIPTASGINTNPYVPGQQLILGSPVQPTQASRPAGWPGGPSARPAATAETPAKICGSLYSRGEHQHCTGGCHRRCAGHRHCGRYQSAELHPPRQLEPRRHRAIHAAVAAPALPAACRRRFAVTAPPAFARRFDRRLSGRRSGPAAGSNSDGRADGRAIFRPTTLRLAPRPPMPLPPRGSAASGTRLLRLRPRSATAAGGRPRCRGAATPPGDTPPGARAAGRRSAARSRSAARAVLVASSMTRADRSGRPTRNTRRFRSDCPRRSAAPKSLPGSGPK